MSTRNLLAVASVAVTLAAALLTPHHIQAQERRLGEIDFPNSGSSDAQAPFIRGVLLLHSFEFEDAATEFRAAQDIDPSFALAYWGEAMTYNHPLWRQQDRDAALTALARYAATADLRQTRAPTEREAAYLASLDLLFGEGSKSQRDRVYMEAMGRLSANYPSDVEARAFHALSILGSTDGERDFATYMRAAAVAQSVFRENPRHPGAVHYMIHSFDDPVHAPLGLPAARAYSGIAPDAAHAQHMTSHIFLASGLWDDVVSANIRARDVQNARRAELGRAPNVCGHYTSWLHYGWLQQGSPEEAEAGMAVCLDRVRGGGTPSERVYFATMRARHVLDTEDWAAAERLKADVGEIPRARLAYDFLTAYAALKVGDRERATELLRGLTALREEMGGESPRAEIAEMELVGLLALEDGMEDQAIETLTRAAALEETLPFEFGPPASLKPPHELLGEVLLELGRYREAAEAFRAALEITPARAIALRGLARSTKGSWDKATAGDIAAEESALEAHLRIRSP